MASVEPPAEQPRVCPQCGFSHLRSSRARSAIEQLQAWWSGLDWFRCDTCGWRGRLRDVWKPVDAFPEVPPLRLGPDLNIDPLQQRDENSLVDLVLERSTNLKQALSVWLDDSRPAPASWLRITTVRNAQRLLEAGLVREISLDYDLGWCTDCIAAGEHLKSSGRRHCEHTPNGYDLVQWMATTGRWPQTPPVVHSGNMEGGARMLGLIARHWHDGAPVAPPAQEAPPFTPLPRSAPDASVATLTPCPRCHGPYLYRTHRHSTLERVRTLLTRRYPVRCSSCGWTYWARDPILVRMSSGDPARGKIENDRLEDIDPD